jgi:hypothetical protein
LKDGESAELKEKLMLFEEEIAFLKQKIEKLKNSSQSQGIDQQIFSDFEHQTQSW